jgi:hypothetical protein
MESFKRYSIILKQKNPEIPDFFVCSPLLIPQFFKGQFISNQFNYKTQAKRISCKKMKIFIWER